MMRRFAKPKQLVVEEGSINTGLAHVLLGKLPQKKVVPAVKPADYSGYGPDTLILAEHRGSFVKPCPGTRGYICCGLKIIHFGLGCSINCTYCILQSYLDTRALVLFSNIEEGFKQVEEVLRCPGFDYRRFCTGEFTDSLLLEDMTGLGARLVTMFARHKNALLELKTKTDRVDSLCGLDHGGRSVVSFSVNAPAVAAKEEPGAASLKRRLAAAKRMVEEGYRVGFHFDPLIRHKGWKDGYARIVADIFSAVPAESIIWISLGAFRFLPPLKRIVARRHPLSRIMYDEFVYAPDGKMRYFRPLRVEMYRYLSAQIKAADPEACIYLCMENPRVWQEVFGFDPGPKGLIEMLNQRV